MKFRERSFPHPVLGNLDDVELYEFQANCTFQGDRQFYYFHTYYKTSNPTLLELLEKGTAAYVLHIECGSTFYRNRFVLTKEQETVKVPADSLRDNVEVNFFICANTDIPGYQIEGSNPDYEDTLFNVKRGDVLAISEGVSFPAEKDYDAIRKVSSIMQVEKSESEDQGLMKVRPTEHKIRIILPAADYEIYAKLKDEDRWATILSGTIVLPALMEAISLVEAGEAGEEGNEGSEDYRWYQILKARLQELPASADSNLLKAQLLYEKPVYRVCSNLSSVVNPKGDEE